MNPIEEYIAARDEQVKINMEDRDLRMNTSRFFGEIVRSNYVKNFTWMGIPILQLPGDLMVMQELIWKIKPNVIVETGVAFGGMIIFYASMMECLQNNGRVFGIDIEFRQHTKDLITKHDLRHRFDFYEGSSISLNIIKSLKNRITHFFPISSKVLVSLDSNHSHDHVLKELNLYAPLVSVGSYIVVFDTTIEFYRHLDSKQDRPWGKGNNPWTAVQEFMRGNDDFVVDREIEERALLTAAPGGWLRRVK